MKNNPKQIKITDGVIMEVIKVNCAHCDAEFMTDRFNVEHFCAPCKAPYLIKDHVMVKGMMYTATNGGYSSDPMLAKVYTRAQAEAYVQINSKAEAVAVATVIDISAVNKQIDNLTMMKQYLNESKPVQCSRCGKCDAVQCNPNLCEMCLADDEGK